MEEMIVDAEAGKEDKLSQLIEDGMIIITT